MAIADISLLAMAIASGFALKLLVDDCRRPIREIADINQYKVMCLLLLAHLAGMVGSFLLPEQDTAIFSGWLGRIWALRYVFAFFLAWLIETFWVAISLRRADWTKFVILPGSAYILTGACLWLWMLRLDNQPEASIEIMANGAVVYPDVFVLAVLTGIVFAFRALANWQLETSKAASPDDQNMLLPMLCATVSGVLGAMVTAIAQDEPQPKSSARSFWTSRYALTSMIVALLSLAWWIKTGRSSESRGSGEMQKESRAPKVVGGMNACLFIFSFLTLPDVKDEPSTGRLGASVTDGADFQAAEHEQPGQLNGAGTHQFMTRLAWGLVGGCTLLAIGCMLGRLFTSTTCVQNDAGQDERAAAFIAEGGGYGTMAPTDEDRRRRDSAELEHRLSEDATELSWSQVLARDSV